MTQIILNERKDGIHIIVLKKVLNELKELSIIELLIKI
jgi:hypothetical protein